MRPLSVLLAFALAIVGLPLLVLPATAAPVNLAGSATVTASSQNTSTGQTAAKAVDGVVAGYPADYTKEWASSGGKAGTTLTLTWASPVTIERVVLYDRPNTNDRVTGASLSFSAGAAVSVGSLNNAGSATTVTVARTVTRLVFTVSSVSAATQNVGLAEIEVWGTADAPANVAPVAQAGADVTAFTNTLVTLSGTASSDANGDPLTYQWTAPAGITLSGATTATPSFTPTAAGSYTFSLVVNDGKVNSVADTVVVRVSAPTSGSTNVARTATATASSQNTTTGQTAAKAIDGSTLGYPTDSTREWASVGGRAATWLELTWSTPVTIDRVVLYDRPNTNDRITAGQLVFSSGSPVAVGSLVNAGTATEVTFPARTVTSLRFTATTVSATTENAGLAEIEVFGSTGTPVNRAPVANAGADVGAVTGTTVTLDGSRSSDPDGNTLTYAWTAPTGVTLANPTAMSPTFTATAKGTYTFGLVVSDGKLSSPADSVVVTVTDPLPVTSNLATSATVQASSQNTTTGQTAAKAIDGSTAGYPTDATREWATVGGRAGSSLSLTWPGVVTLDRVVLFDRPNVNDQITSARLVFSHGAPVTVNALNNDGTATTVTLPAPMPVTGLTLEITGVSGTTENVGLAEIQAFGTAGGVLPNRPPVADAGAALNAVTGRTVTLDGTDSEDPDGNALTYAWTASGGTLTNPTSATPTFKADAPGAYTLTLVVSDGKASSAPDSVIVTVAANRAPVADAGTDQTVAPGATVTLSGSGTDPENDGLTYAWTAPAGVTLTGATTAKPTFTAGTTPGSSYEFALTVTDGELTSPADTVVVTVAPLGVLTVVTNANGSATWTADFESSYSGRSVRLQRQTIPTIMGADMMNYVATASWVTVGNAVTANPSGNATFTVSNPLEVSHRYRAVVDQGTAGERFTNELAYEAPRTTRNTGLATVYIDTNGAETIASKDDYWEGKFTMNAPTGSRCTSVAPATMKVSGRGNSTWDLPKKPYKFALDKAANLCGMGSFKKWNLIANYEDDALIRNTVAMKMGASMSGLEWTPKSIPVDVYVNGVFQGSYTLMDRVTVDPKGRVNVPKLEDNEGGVNDSAPNVTGGYLLEWDNRRTSHHNVFVGSDARTGFVGEEQDGDYNGRGWVGIKEPEDESDGSGITAAQINYIDSYLEEADEAIGNGNWEPYIDANSAADYIIAMELTKNYGANMRSSVFMYKKRDADPAAGDQGKLFFGPLWDFDTSFGNATHAGALEATTDGWWVSEEINISAYQGTPTWFHDMMDDPDFRSIVVNRWNAMKTAGFKAQMDAFITSESDFVAASAAADATVWGSNDFSGAVDELQTWFTARWNWLDSQW